MSGILAKKATIYPQKHRSGNVTWKVKVGKSFDGKAKLKSFATKIEAENYANEWNIKLVNGHNAGLQDLDTVSRHEVLAALAKLKAYNATLHEAVEFFLKFARPEKGQITIAEAITIFLDAKETAGRASTYVRGYRMTFLPPFQRFFGNTKLLAEITPGEATSYIESHKNLNDTSRASHISYLRTFFNFHMKKGYARHNPFMAIDKPIGRTQNPKTLSPTSVKSLLQFALDTDCKAECACMVLVFFCGIRVQEVGRLSWERVNFDSREVTVEWEEAKKRKRRVNAISDNAIEWLKLCQSTGSIAPNDYDQRMKRLRKKSGIEYYQNAMRHCFAGYHISKFKDAAKTATMLSHPNASLLYSTYYAMVKPKDTETYWEILPNEVMAQRESEAARKKQEENDSARDWAEQQSNCGEAVQDEEGDWLPVQRYSHSNDENA